MLAVRGPASDAMVAWTLFSDAEREAFFAELGADAATRARGRGWALCAGVVALVAYADTNPVMAGIARHAIDEVLFDREHAL